MPPSPYKCLENYGVADADNFFGRQAEIEALRLMVAQERLTLLYGASGTGKTSLLLAGLEPALTRQVKPRYHVLYIRPFKDLLASLQQTAQALLPSDQLQEPHSPRHQFQMDMWDLLAKHFNHDELEDLCFRLRVLYEDLPGGGLRQKTRALLASCERHNRLPALVDACRLMRPGIHWPSPLLATLHEVTGARDCHLVLILDQFEEFFTARFTRQARQAFIHELSLMHKDTSLPVHLVLSLAEDQLANLSEAKEQIESVYTHMMRLEFLSREQAYEAMTRPVATLGVSYEEALVEKLLDDLLADADVTTASPKAIMPPQLQLVCHALYTQVQANPSRKTQSKLIKLADYEHLEGTAGLLRRYLEQELQRLAEKDRSLAKMLLETFVSEKVATSAQLAGNLGVGETAVLEVLDQLVSARLVRRLQQDQMVAYELIHDYLALTPEMQLRKAVEELIAQALRDWRKFGTLIGTERLELILEWRDRLKLSQEARSLISKSLQQRELAQQQQLQLIELDKNAFLNQLMLGVNKKITSPVASVRSNSDFLQEDIEAVRQWLTRQRPAETVGLTEVMSRLQDMADIAAELGEASWKIARLIEALNHFVQPTEQNEPPPIDVQAQLQAAVLLLEHQTLTHNIQIDMELTKNWYIIGDSAQFVYLFMTILHYSIEALKAQADGKQPQVIKVLASIDGRCGVLDFCHRGAAAFQAESLSAGFDSALFQGLGLAIAYQIVQRHKGALELLKQNTEEIKLTIRLPLTDLESSFI